MIYNFTLNPDSELNREILTAWLAQFDFEAFEDTESALKAYSPEAIEGGALNSVLAGLDFHVSYSTMKDPDINWNEEWEKNYFHPIVIGNDCLIRAPFHHDYPQARYEIVIDPNMAFGTGHHETTELMVEHILEIDVSDKKVLDMGCGTGVLGILASMCGCSEVTAIDIDTHATNSVVENTKFNNINNISVFTGDANLLKGKSFDLILANIQRNIILEDMEQYVEVLTPDGYLIVSGFYEEDLESVMGRAYELQLVKGMIRKKNNWIACSFTKS